MNTLEHVFITTLHRRFDDHPFVTMFEGMEMRVVHVRPAEKLVVMQIRSQPLCRSTLHRHEGSTFGFTTRGAWGHEADRCLYEPNSYVWESVNELHRFHNGSDITEAYFVIFGDVVHYDDEGREVIRRSTAATTAARYLALCEEAGLHRPDLQG